MKKWVVQILDGDGIYHSWHVDAVDKFSALLCVLIGWNSENYGMPYGIEKSGIRDVSVFPLH